MIWCFIVIGFLWFLGVFLALALFQASGESLDVIHAVAALFWPLAVIITLVRGLF